jgi:hypothetical protein
MRRLTKEEKKLIEKIENLIYGINPLFPAYGLNSFACLTTKEFLDYARR